MADEPKPELHLVPPTVQGAIALFEKLTGKTSTPEDIAKATAIFNEFLARRPPSRP